MRIKHYAQGKFYTIECPEGTRVVRNSTFRASGKPEPGRSDQEGGSRAAGPRGRHPRPALPQADGDPGRAAERYPARESRDRPTAVGAGKPGLRREVDRSGRRTRRSTLPGNDVQPRCAPTRHWIGRTSRGAWPRRPQSRSPISGNPRRDGPTPRDCSTQHTSCGVTSPDPTKSGRPRGSENRWPAVVHSRPTRRCLCRKAV